MSSPIMHSRKEIGDAILDEMEQEYLGGVKEYREMDFYKEFNNYKSYYLDAYM